MIRYMLQPAPACRRADLRNRRWPEVDRAIPTVFCKVTDPEERKSAEQVSPYYVVKIEVPDEALPVG
jgi:hypothetical protein